MKRRSAPETERREVLRVGVVSLGCPKNLVDTEVMLGHLDRAGCVFVTVPAEADVLLVNTCAFIDTAREESVRTLLEAADLKKSGRVRRIVAAGCLVQRHREELRESLPEVDAFVGLDELERVVEHAGAAPAGSPALRVLPASPPPPARGAAAGPQRSTYLYDDRTPRLRATLPWTAFVKIAEGCDHTCSFCAIPSFRGGFRSRRLGSILREAQDLAAAGVREINLIAQDSSHFGRDLGLEEGLSQRLAGLDEIEALRWIRLHYLYPNTVTERLVDTLARLPRVVKYVDLPLQHAHPETLRRMRRGGSGETHLALLGRFRRAMPDVALRTTFLTGFPGETEREFETLLEFVRAARFDHVGVFTYSHEQDTGAFAMDDDVPAEVKEERRARLLTAQQSIALERNRRWVGRTVEVLVEGAHPETEHLLVARMSTQAPEVDGQVLVNDGFARPGEFVRAEITGIAGYDLVGRVLRAS